jgi:hypothetical protein
MVCLSPLSGNDKDHLHKPRLSGFPRSYRHGAGRGVIGAAHEWEMSDSVAVLIDYGLFQERGHSTLVSMGYTVIRPSLCRSSTAIRTST